MATPDKHEPGGAPHQVAAQHENPSQAVRNQPSGPQVDMQLQQERQQPELTPPTPMVLDSRHPQVEAAKPRNG
ncbi:LysR family transcriptional regulator, partial [Stenotrophomonas maltophilia]|uniref:hypothetical protein n=1 Tax=Stenotrophomonas maltophilia TaxID=40324 RepID=UPI0034E3323F